MIVCGTNMTENWTTLEELVDLYNKKLNEQADVIIKLKKEIEELKKDLI